MRGRPWIAVAEPSLHEKTARIFPVMAWESVLGWGDTACSCLARMFHPTELPPNEIQN